MAISRNFIFLYLLIVAFMVSETVQWKDDERYKNPGPQQNMVNYNYPPMTLPEAEYDDGPGRVPPTPIPPTTQAWDSNTKTFFPQKHPVIGSRKRSIYSNDNWDESAFYGKSHSNWIRPTPRSMSKSPYYASNGKYGYPKAYKSPTPSAGSFGRSSSSPMAYSKSHLNYGSRSPTPSRSPFNLVRSKGYKSSFRSPSYGRMGLGSASAGHKSPVPSQYQNQATIAPKRFNVFSKFVSGGKNEDIVAALDRIAARIR